MTNPSDSEELLFSGLKVVDCGTWIAGPVAGTILADFGASVTKVEVPGAGDPYRAPKDYRKQALASVTTHDLPPTAGYLNFAHVKLREELHLLSEPVEAFAASAMAERTLALEIGPGARDELVGLVDRLHRGNHAQLRQARDIGRIDDLRMFDPPAPVTLVG